MANKRMSKVLVAVGLAAAVTVGLSACASNDAGSARLLRMVTHSPYQPHHAAPSPVGP